MLQQISGAALLVAGFFVFAFGPLDRIQIEPFSRLARVFGLAMMILGVLLLRG